MEKHDKIPAEATNTEKKPTGSEIQAISNETSEQLKDLELAKFIKEKGIKDPEARKKLFAWMDEQEEKVDLSGDKEAPIQYNLRLARLYFNAGCLEQAHENFKDVATQAWNERRDELYNNIKQEMEEKGF